MKVTDKCRISDGQLENFKECHGIIQLGISLAVLSAGVESAGWCSELL